MDALEILSRVGTALPRYRQGFAPLRCERCRHWDVVVWGSHGYCEKARRLTKAKAPCQFGWGTSYPIRTPGDTKPVGDMTDDEYKAFLQEIGLWKLCDGNVKDAR